MNKIKEVAATIACEIITYPTSPEYTDETLRKFQGCPTIAITRGGRIFAAWYSGGSREPHIDNFNLIVISDDHGKSWSKPIAVIPSSRERLVHALDIQLFTAPDGRLFVYWVQNNVKSADATDENGKPIYSGLTVDGYVFNDFTHAMWYSVCDNPDADTLVFGEPKYADKGFLRCKPLVMSDGRWLCFNYSQDTDRYGYSISADNGATYEHFYGSTKLATDFDETMAYEKKNGEIRMLARALDIGVLAETSSSDGCKSWSETKKSPITSPNTRFFIGRAPSGRLLLVHNDHPKLRTRMTIALSDDDGESFKWSRCIDTREDLSYPDVDCYGDRIRLVYDRERTKAREIYFVDFTEEDIIDETRPIEIRTISKGRD